MKKFLIAAFATALIMASSFDVNAKSAESASDKPEITCWMNGGVKLFYRAEYIAYTTEPAYYSVLIINRDGEKVKMLFPVANCIVKEAK